MKRLAFPVFALLLLVVGVPFAAHSVLGTTVALAKTKPKQRPTGTVDPEAVVRNIYSEYSKAAGPAEAQQQYFSPTLFQLWMDVQQGASSVDDIGVDFDVFLDAQDLDAVSNLTTTFTPDGSDKGVVLAKFTAFGKQKAVTYEMLHTPVGWKIDDISWGPKRKDLRQVLAAIKANQGQAD